MQAWEQGDMTSLIWSPRLSPCASKDNFCNFRVHLTTWGQKKSILAWLLGKKKSWGHLVLHLLSWSAHPLGLQSDRSQNSMKDPQSSTSMPAWVFTPALLLLTHVLSCWASSYALCDSRQSHFPVTCSCRRTVLWRCVNMLFSPGIGYSQNQKAPCSEHPGRDLPG